MDFYMILIWILLFISLLFSLLLLYFINPNWEMMMSSAFHPSSGGVVRVWTFILPAPGWPVSWFLPPLQEPSRILYAQSDNAFIYLLCGFNIKILTQLEAPLFLLSFYHHALQKFCLASWSCDHTFPLTHTHSLCPCCSLSSPAYLYSPSLSSVTYLCRNKSRLSQRLALSLSLWPFSAGQVQGDSKPLMRSMGK